MFNYIKFVVSCVMQMFDFIVGNVDKSPYEKQMAVYGILGGVVFVACFLIMLFKLAPKKWSFIKHFFISFIPSLVVILIYFLIIYLVTK